MSSGVVIGLVAILVTFIIVVVVILVLYFTGHLGSCGSKSSPPAAPTNLNPALADSTPTSLALVWSPSTSSGVNYIVTYQPVNSSTWLTATSNNSTTTYTVTGLSPATQYNFQVAATKSGATSSPISTQATTYGQITSFRTLATSSTGLSFAWDAYVNETDYILYAYTSGKSLSNPDAQTQVTGDSGRLGNLKPNTSYTIVILCVSQSSKSLGWATLNVSTTTSSDPVLVIPPFTQFNVTATDTTSISLSWSVVAGAASYTYGDVNAGKGTSTLTTSGTITGLVTGTLYTVGVVAIDINGNPLAESTTTSVTAK